MAYICCNRCGIEITGLKEPHTCNFDDIDKYIYRLNQERYACYAYANNVREKFFRLLAETSTEVSFTKQGINVPIPIGLLDELWKTINEEFYGAKCANDFTTRWIAMHMTLSQAASLFKTGGKDSWYNLNHSMKERLTRLHEEVIGAWQDFNYNEERLDISVDEVINRIIKEETNAT